MKGGFAWAKVANNGEFALKLLAFKNRLSTPKHYVLVSFFILVSYVIFPADIQAQNKAQVAPATYSTPVGFWLSEATKSQFGGVFQIYQEGDEIKGKIVRLLPRIGHPDDDLNTRCGGCTGPLKDHPTVGLPFIYGFTLEKDQQRWSGGKVIDSRSGKAYSARMEVVENGKKLKVRGYLGTPLLGATVYWTRVTSINDLRSPL